METTSQDQCDDQRLVVKIINDARVRFDERPSEVYPLTGVPSADLRQSLFVHFYHVQFEVRPKPLVVELYDAGQTTYFYLYDVDDDKMIKHKTNVHIIYYSTAIVKY